MSSRVHAELLLLCVCVFLSVAAAATARESLLSYGRLVSSRP